MKKKKQPNKKSDVKRKPKGKAVAKRAAVEKVSDKDRRDALAVAAGMLATMDDNGPDLALDGEDGDGFDFPDLDEEDDQLSMDF